LRMTLQTLLDNQLYAKLSKCDFWLEEVKFLVGVYKRRFGLDIDQNLNQTIYGGFEFLHVQTKPIDLEDQTKPHQLWRFGSV
jgi:hypothetical protein